MPKQHRQHVELREELRSRGVDSSTPGIRGEARHEALRSKLFDALGEEEAEWGYGSLLAWVASRGLVSGNANALAKGDFAKRAHAAAFEKIR